MYPRMTVMIPRNFWIWVKNCIMNFHVMAWPVSNCKPENERQTLSISILDCRTKFKMFYW